VSDSRKANQSESAPADLEKLLTQAGVALKTGASAYENGNYAFAETLFIKALDLYEQAGKLDGKEYFQCLHQIADTYFQLGRYFEAKSYYERLSVARLKNPDSTDAQVVVALLKLASTYEKLGEANEALTAFDLIMELAEKTIPNGHALFGVIFDSYEALISRQVTDPAEVARREVIIGEKREQFGFSKTASEARWADAVAEQVEEGNASENVLSQGTTQLRKNLKAWTDSPGGRSEPALGQAVQRGNQELLSSLEERTSVERTDGVVHAHLHPDMFRRKPPMDREGDGEAAAGDFSAASSEQIDESDLAPQIELQMNAPMQVEAKPGSMRPKPSADKSAVKAVKKIDTDRKRFNPIPALTALVCLAAVGGAVLFAYDFTKKSASIPVKTNGEAPAVDYKGRSWSSSDGKMTLTCTGPFSCEYTVGGAKFKGTYQIQGQPGPEKSTINELFNGKPTDLQFGDIAGSLRGPDGTVLYSDSSPGHKILSKAQALSAFANEYFSSHGHVYPSDAKDFEAAGTSFTWDNAISGKDNPPVIKKLDYSKTSFDTSLMSQLKNFRDGKFLFESDSTTGGPPGLIECMALLPGEAESNQTGGTEAVKTDGNAAGGGSGKFEGKDCAFLIRAYDSDGKMICASDPKKVYVIYLKNGVALDPATLLHEEPVDSLAPSSRVEVTINPLKDPSAADLNSAR